MMPRLHSRSLNVPKTLILSLQTKYRLMRTFYDLLSLKMIAIAATGYNNVNVEHYENIISPLQMQGYANQSVPEHVIGSVCLTA